MLRAFLPAALAAAIISTAADAGTAVTISPYGIPVHENPSGMPVEVSTNGTGILVRYVANTTGVNVNGLSSTPVSTKGGFPGYTPRPDGTSPGGVVGTPLVIGDRIAWLGCSREAETGWRSYPRAVMQGIARKVDTNAFSWFGFPGSTPVQFAVQLPNLLATRPHVMVIGDWVNATTPGAPLPLATHTAAVTSYMQQFGAQSQAKEIWLMPTVITEGATTQSRAYQASVRAWCISMNGTMVGNAFVRYFDVDNDYSTALGKQRTYDGTHTTTTDAFYHLGKSLRDQINAILPTGRTLPVVGTAPAGNLTTNPNLTGTTGTIGGVGAADVSGTVPTGIALNKTIAAGGNITVVANAATNAFDIKLSGSMVSQTGDIQILVTLPTLTKFGKYRCLIKYELSNGARNGPASLLYQLGANLQNASGGVDGHGPQLGGIGAVDTGPSSLGMGGYGLIPSQIDSTGYYATNPETGVAESLGETWLITDPTTLATTASSLRILFTPYTGTTVDANLRILAIYLVPIAEPITLPFYQAGLVDRGDATFLRFGASIAGLYTSSGNFPSTNSQNSTYTITQANANAAWVLTPGDWSGGNIIGGGISYDQKAEVSTDGGATYSTVLYPSAAAIGWAFSAASAGLVTGNKVRFTTTATTTAGSTSAVEIMTIT